MAAGHTKALVGKTFKATSPNGRFADGAAAIDGKPFRGIEAVGKNLFAWFGRGADEVVVHVHFGMAGQWSVFGAGEAEPPTTATTRLRLAHAASGTTSHLSAMTVALGTRAGLYAKKVAVLGEDPLRDDADPEALWRRVSASAKSIGALIMDQSYFCGPGNIYRAEILFKARVHPDRPGRDLAKAEFDLIWDHAVALLRRGFDTGSILTVDAADAARDGGIRRYVYNASRCPLCATRVAVWDIAGRTAYACPSCQPRHPAAAPATPAKKTRAGAAKKTRAAPAKKTKRGAPGGVRAAPPPRTRPRVSAEKAAVEKVNAGESRAVEHVAELHPTQAARAARAARRRRG